MAELLLHVTFLDLDRRGEARAQRVSAKFPRPLAFRKIAAYSGRERCGFDESRDMAIVQAIDADMTAVIHANVTPSTSSHSMHSMWKFHSGHAATESLQIERYLLSP